MVYLYRAINEYFYSSCVCVDCNGLIAGIIALKTRGSDFGPQSHTIEFILEFGCTGVEFGSRLSLGLPTCNGCLEQEESDGWSMMLTILSP